MDEARFAPDQKASATARTHAGSLVYRGLLVYCALQDLPIRKLMSSRAKPRLTQTVNPKLQRQFEFLDGRRLGVSEQGRRKSRSYVIDIIAVDPRHRSTTRIPWHWLKLAIGTAMVALIGWLALGPGGKALTLVLAASGATSITALVIAIRGTVKRVVYVSCHAHLPLLELEVNQPDPIRFKEFVACLERCIADTHRARKLEKDQHVAGEMRMLRRLTDAGVFERAVYRGARSRLLAKF